MLLLIEKPLECSFSKKKASDKYIKEIICAGKDTIIIRIGNSIVNFGTLQFVVCVSLKTFGGRRPNFSHLNTKEIIIFLQQSVILT